MLTDKKTLIVNALGALSILPVSMVIFHLYTRERMHKFNIDQDMVNIVIHHHYLFLHIILTLVLGFLFLIYLRSFLKIISSVYISLQHAFQKRPNLDWCIVSFAIIGISTILYYQYIFGDRLFIFSDIGSDTLRAYYPELYYYLANVARGDIYSFNHGLGSDYLLKLLIYSLDLFTIVHLFSGPDKLGSSLVYVNILKITVSGILFFKFISLIVQNRTTCITISLLFAFNGYIILWGQHYHFASYIVYFVFLLYSLELYFQKNKKVLLYISLALCLLSLYFFYKFFILTSVYIIFRCLYFKNNIKDFCFKYFNFSITAFIVFLLMAFITLPSLHMLLSSPRIDTESTWYISVAQLFSLQSAEYYFSAASRLFSNNLTGFADNYFGFRNYYESPQLYSGLVSILLLPLVFFVRDKKIKLACIFLAAVSFAGLIFPFFAGFMNGFQIIHYRWTFGIIIFILIITAIIMDQLFQKKIVFHRLLFSCVFVLIISIIFAVVLILFFGEKKILAMSGQFMLVFIFLVILSLLLIRTRQTRFKIILFAFICLELILLNYPTVNYRETVSKENIPYYDSAYEAIAEIRSKDQDPFYRIDKEFFSVRGNDSLVQDYFGLKSYSSLNPDSYIDFTLFFGLNDGQLRHLPARGSRIERFNLQDILGVKYFLSYNSASPANYEFVHKTGGVYTYKNQLARPLAFMYHNYTSESRVRQISDELKDVRVHSSIIVEPEVQETVEAYIPPYEASPQSDHLFRQYSGTGDIRVLKQALRSGLEVYHHDRHGDTALHMAVTNNDPEAVRLLLDHGADPLLVNTSRQTPLNLAAGLEDQTIYRLLKEERSSDNQVFRITDFSRSSISGSIKTHKDGVLFFSIPYSKGWNITVNGQETDFYRVNAGFIGLPLRAGEYNIEMNYITPYFRMGLAVSMTTMLLLILYILSRSLFITGYVPEDRRENKV